MRNKKISLFLAALLALSAAVSCGDSGKPEVTTNGDS